MIETKMERLAGKIISLVLGLLGLLCLAPLVHIFATSVSNNIYANLGEVTFLPKGFTLVSYEQILASGSFWRAMWISVVRLVMGVVLQLTLTVLSAYPLSKDNKEFRARTVIAWIFFIPMIFGGGTIPWFLTIHKLGILNTIWALVLPGGVSTFFVLLILNFFRGIPKDLEEAAVIDGASPWRIMLSIYVPLSKPALATIAVYSMLGIWNSWFDGMILMSTPKNYPLMTYLQSATVPVKYDNLTSFEIARLSKIGDKTLRAAKVFIGTLPILATYPFFQKYFTKGLLLGSVKG